MTALETFQSIARHPAEVAQEYRAQGKRVVGYRCLYVPEEIIWAAGMLPYPLYGTPEPVGLADSYFQSCTCEFIRNIFDHALSERLDFLDGLALCNTCDAVRRLYDLWNAYVDGPPAYLLTNPQKLMSETNRSYYLEELHRFRSAMGKLAGQEIGDAELSEAIALHNETRTLLKQLNALRQQEQPPLTGSEALDVCTATTVLPKDRANPLLRQLLDELSDRSAPDADGPRVMVTGSVLEHPALIQMIEEQGAMVVADDLCNTSRYYWHTVEPDGDPLEALYQFFNQRCLCACMHPVESRLSHVLELVEQFDVEAVIQLNLKYCHPFLYEAPLLTKALAAIDVPSTVLEIGHDMSGHGQLRTRIQAFVEMVEF